jgi:hypothetical protein
MTAEQWEISPRTSEPTQTARATSLAATGTPEWPDLHRFAAAAHIQAGLAKLLKSIIQMYTTLITSLQCTRI